MQANELRIGNYVEHKQGLWSHRIDYWPENEYGITIDEPIFQWTENDWYQVGECGIIDFNFIKPILLTEDWLLKFGFNIYFDSDNLRKARLNEFKLSGYAKNKPNYWWLSRYMAPLNKACEYVHQLQNLYFALTGKELTCSQN